MVNMSKMEGNDPINDYKVIREELSKYSKKLANKTCGKGIDLRTEKGYVVWWPKKSIEDSMCKIKETSPFMNEWLEELFCYKVK